MKTLTILTAGLMVTAASAQAPRGDAYRAAGTEPFWSLTIDAAEMRFEPIGGRAVTAPTPQVIHGFAGEIYRTPRLSVNVIHARCSDGMSDRNWPDTVTVEAAGRTWKGCGGGTEVARSRLAGTRWTVWQVNGRPIRTTRPLTVNFTADRIEGKLCNAFGGGYSMNGSRLTVRNVIATQMACGGPAGTTEAALFRMWRRPMTASVSRWGTLTLRSGRDVATLRPAR